MIRIFGNPSMANPVIILGARRLGRVVLDILQRSSIVVYGFLDDDPNLWSQTVDHVPVLGDIAERSYWDLIGNECTVFVAVEDQRYRQRLIAVLHEQHRGLPVNAMHPSAVVAASVGIGHGNLLSAGVVLGTNAAIGSHCILHTRAIIEHDATVQSFVQVGAGSVVGPGVKLGERVFVGAGVTIVGDVEVGKAASIAAGSVVLANVKAGEVVLGNPAQPVRNSVNSISTIRDGQVDL